MTTIQPSAFHHFENQVCPSSPPHPVVSQYKLPSTTTDMNAVAKPVAGYKSVAVHYISAEQWTRFTYDQKQQKPLAPKVNKPILKFEVRFSGKTEPSVFRLRVCHVTGHVKAQLASGLCFDEQGDLFQAEDNSPQLKLIGSNPKRVCKSKHPHAVVREPVILRTTASRPYVSMNFSSLYTIEFSEPVVSCHASYSYRRPGGERTIVLNTHLGSCQDCNIHTVPVPTCLKRSSPSGACQRRSGAKKRRRNSNSSQTSTNSATTSSSNASSSAARRQKRQKSRPRSNNSTPVMKPEPAAAAVARNPSPNDELLFFASIMTAIRESAPALSS